MSAAEQESETYVREFLESLHFNVQPIPRAATPTADFRAVRDSQVHVVEVKEKGGDAGRRQAGPIEVRPIIRTNPLSSVVCDADEQLRCSTSSATEVRIVWIHCVGQASDVLLQQAPRTLYGIETLRLYEGPRYQPVGEKDCLYFGHSDFPRCPDIDAAIVSGDDKWAMFLNEFSPRADLAKSSPLCTAFGQVFDPRVVVAAGQYLSCDGRDVDRSVEAQSQAYVARKYGYSGVARTAEIHCRAVLRP